MKQILFLDDDKRRIHEFYQRLISAENDITIVETADACIAELNRQSFDLVCLDHDLGGEIYCDSSREDCGMEVVRWLKSNRREHGAFIVHTMNTIAAAAMYIDLNAMGYHVQQAVFGSPEFYQHVYLLLQDDTSGAEPPSKSLVSRVGEYFRSLRLKR
jgi:ActR/RegA family two-component response regulator